MLTAGRRTGPTLLPLLSLLAFLLLCGACGNRPLPLSSAVAGKGGLAGAFGGALGQASGGTGGSLAGAGGELVAGVGEGGADATGGTGGTGGSAAGLAAGGSARLPDGGTSNGGLGVSDCTGRIKGTVCGAGICADGVDGSVIRGRYACDGRGNCNPSEDVVCAPFACDAKSGGCLTACANDADCTNGKPCLNGSCGPKALGATCVSSAECGSGICADGVCCNTTCATTCVSCAIPTHVGTCWPTASGDPDPRGTCAKTNPASCGRNGTCDGVGGCANYPVGTPCGSAACREANDGMYGSTAKCNGVGTCVRTTTSCAPFSCAAELGECRTTCSTDTDCIAGRACVNGSCGLKEQACTADGECLSGFCAQGICCQSRCDGTCQSCALPGSIGICRPVPASDGSLPCTTSP